MRRKSDDGKIMLINRNDKKKKKRKLWRCEKNIGRKKSIRKRSGENVTREGSGKGDEERNSAKMRKEKVEIGGEKGRGDKRGE